MKDSEKGFIDYMKGMSFKDIAKKRNVSISTVKTWSQRGINNVKWNELKKDLTDSDGVVDIEKALQYVNGSGKQLTVNNNENGYNKFIQNVSKDKQLIQDCVKGCLFNFQYQQPPQTDKEVETMIYNYFSFCEQTATIPTVAGLATSLHISRTTLHEWEHNERKESRTVRAELIKNAKNAIMDFKEKMATLGKMPPATFIFLSCNDHGYKNTNTIEHINANDNKNALENVEDIKERIINIDTENE